MISLQRVENTPDVDNFAPIIHQIGSFLSRDPREGGVSRADLAELRDLHTTRGHPPALWKILLDFVPGAGQLDLPTHRRWTELIHNMAVTTGLHDPGTSLGWALAEAGWSELRFVRLMRARGGALSAHIRQVGKFLSAKGQPANWADAARLIFVQQGEPAATARLDVARRFYQRLYSRQAQGL